jgi:hypothetical protein
MHRSEGHPRRALSQFPLHALGRPRARLGNPNTGIPEVVVQPIYDIYFVAPATAFPLLTLFSQPKGSTYNFGGVAAFPKGFGHTNLIQNAMLESSYSMIVQAIALTVQAEQGTAHPLLHPEDLINLLSCYGRWEVNRKQYFEGILAWLPSGGGATMNGFGTLTAAASTFVASNGLTLTQNVYAIPGGQYINPQEAVDFIIDPTGNALSAGGIGAPSTLAAAGNPTGVPAAGISAWLRLDGTLFRVAQ